MFMRVMAVLLMVGLMLSPGCLFEDEAFPEEETVIEVARGCTDENAENYNQSAEEDDGSCTYAEPDPIFGCTDPTAFNYDPFATSDDSSCTYCNDNVVQVNCDGGSWQGEVSWSIMSSDGTIFLKWILNPWANPRIASLFKFGEMCLSKILF